MTEPLTNAEKNSLRWIHLDASFQNILYALEQGQVDKAGAWDAALRAYELMKGTDA